MKSGLLEREMKTYLAHKPELLRENSGKWALVRGDDIVGTFAARDDALQEAYDRFGRGPFLIVEVQEIEPTIDFSLNPYVE